MTVHKVAEAFPNGSTSVDTIRQKLAAGFVSSINAANDIQAMDFLLAGWVAVPEIIIVRDTGLIYGRDPTSTGPHNGVTILGAASGQFFVAPLAAQSFTNVLDLTNTPPGSPAAGDRYIVGTAPTGAWASNADDLTFWDGLQWVFVNPVIGQRVYHRAAEVDYQWTEAGTWDSGSTGAGSVGAQELAFPWGMVVVSETATPPGTRHTTATPTMPLGGTAANINDDSTATEATTSALGNLSAASADGRVVAKLDLGADTALNAIQVKGIKCSAGSSSASAMGLYYATAAAPTTWIQLSTGFTLSTADQDVARSGTFTARYVAVITEAKDWTTTTHTIDDLNAYKQATSIADGVKYLVAANGFGAFASQDTKVAEAWNGAFRFYTAYNGAAVFNDTLGFRYRYESSSGTWVPDGGASVGFKTTGFTASATLGLWAGTVDYAYLVGTAPAINSKGSLAGTLTYAAKRVGDRLRFKFTGYLGGTSTSGWLGIIQDSDTNAVRWTPGSNTPNVYLNEEMIITVNDTASHTYRLIIGRFTGETPNCANREFTLEELLPSS